MCIANDDEKAAMGVAAAALVGSVNGEKADAAVVIEHAISLGVARMETWPDIPHLGGTEAEV